MKSMFCVLFAFSFPVFAWEGLDCIDTSLISKGTDLGKILYGEIKLEFLKRDFYQELIVSPVSDFSNLAVPIRVEDSIRSMEADERELSNTEVMGIREFFDRIRNFDLSDLSDYFKLSDYFEEGGVSEKVIAQIVRSSDFRKRLASLNKEDLRNVLEAFKTHGQGALLIVFDIIGETDGNDNFSIELTKFLSLHEHATHVLSAFCRDRACRIYSAHLLATHVETTIENNRYGELVQKNIPYFVALLLKMNIKGHYSPIQRTPPQPPDSSVRQALTNLIPEGGVIGESQTDIAQYLYELLIYASPFLSSYLGESVEKSTLDLSLFFAAIDKNIREKEDSAAWLMNLIRYPRLLQALHQIFSCLQCETGYIAQMLIQNTPDQLNRWIVEPATVEEALIGLGFIPYSEFISHQYGDVPVTLNGLMGNHYLSKFNKSDNQEKASKVMVACLRYLKVNLEVDENPYQYTDMDILSSIQSNLEAIFNTENHGGMTAARILTHFVGVAGTSRVGRSEYQQSVNLNTREVLKQIFDESGMKSGELDELDDDVLESYKVVYGSDPQCFFLVRAIDEELKRRSEERQAQGAAGGGCVKLDSRSIINEVHIQGCPLSKIEAGVLFVVLLGDALSDGNIPLVESIMDERKRRRGVTAAARDGDLSSLTDAALKERLGALLASGGDFTAVSNEIGRRRNDNPDGSSTSGSSSR